MGRVENSIKNITFAVFAQLITAMLTFITRTVMIRQLGIEAVALNSLFTEVIAALSLAELGVGSAIIYNLYKPLAENDSQKVSQLMNLFKDAYRIIAVVTILVGMLICPWIQYFIKEIEYDIVYLRTIYLLFVFQCATSYLFSYKGALLNADQKSRVIARVSTVIRIIGTIVLIIVLILFENYIAYLMGNIVLHLSINIVVSCKVDRMYPFLLKNEKLPREERRDIFINIKNIFFKQLAGKVVDSTDNILISTLVSTVLVGYYANYLSVIGIIKAFTSQLSEGITASLGNLFVNEDKVKCEQVLNRLNYIFVLIGSIASIGTFACIQSFIKLWLGYEFLLEYNIIFICCINLFCYIAIKPLSTAMHLIGHFDIGRNISICSAISNLIFSIFLGKRIGMFGIFVGTFLVYIIEYIAKTYYVYKIFFMKSSMRALINGGLAFSKMLVSILICGFFVCFIDFKYEIYNFIILGAISVIVSTGIVVLFSSQTDEFRYVKKIVVVQIKKYLRI